MPQITFEKSLKPRTIEEFADFYFYRRIAHLLVPTLIKLNLSPNQISLISMFTGFAGASLIYRQFYVWGSLLCIFAICLDCCDGQIARLTGKTSSTGRMVDGLCDMFWIIAFWLSIYYSYPETLANITYLKPFMYFTGFWMWLHCWRFDGIRIQYFELISHDLGKKDLSPEEIQKQKKEQWAQGNYVESFLTWCMGIHRTFFSPKPKPKVILTAHQRQELDSAMSLWPWIGESHHLTPLIIGTLFLSFTSSVLLAAFWLIAVPYNIWWLYCEWRWRKAVMTKDGK